MGNSGSAHARGGKWLELVIRCAYFAVNMFVCLSNANVIKLVSETSERELKKVFFASLDAARVCSRFWFSVTQAVSRE